MPPKTASGKIAYWFVFQNDRLLTVPNEETHFLLTNTSIASIKDTFIRQHRLIELDEFEFFCAELSVESSIPTDINPLPMRKALELFKKDWYSIAAKAYAIVNWDKNHQFCGRCGHPTELISTSFERKCTHCGLSFYPRISPSIIVRIHKGDQILMARGYQFLPGAYGLIAGFVEAGESVEDAVHREVKEEVGIEIKNLKYYGSQAWPFPDSLMIAFTADYASGELEINPDEIEEAGWFDIHTMPGRPFSSVSIARKLVDDFIAQQKNGR